MMRRLSQLWVSSSADRGKAPPTLWRWTFGRFKSHRDFASSLRDLDTQLSRQAASQQRALAQQQEPVGRYRPRNEAGPVTAPWWSGLLRPAAAAGVCVLLVCLAWALWPNIPKHEPDALPRAFADSFERLKEPLEDQAQFAGQMLRDQTDHVRRLPQHLPPIDRVVNGLGEAIQSPIREEVRRFTRDMTEPWVYFANQLPLPARRDTQEPTGSGV